MKKHILPLLLTTAPLFAGEPAPIMAPAPAPACDCPQGFTLGLEAMALRPYADAEDGEDGFEFGYRASLGYEFGDCLFVKLTGFGYSADLLDSEGDDGEGGILEETAEADMAYVDLVIGQHFCPDEKLTLSPYVGLRWASVETEWKDAYSDDAGLYDADKWEEDFDGLGIVVGIDATRSLGNNFSLYGTAKQSVVFGEYDYTASDWEDEDGFEEYEEYNSDSVGFISEFGLGVQYDFAFSNVAANVRAGVEGQWWTGENDDIGLAGFVLGANFTF